MLGQEPDSLTPSPRPGDACPPPDDDEPNRKRGTLRLMCVIVTSAIARREQSPKSRKVAESFRLDPRLSEISPSLSAVGLIPLRTEGYSCIFIDIHGYTWIFMVSINPYHEDPTRTGLAFAFAASDVTLYLRMSDRLEVARRGEGE
jgi:hypothetical protein